ncbi:hypothetical protein GQ55_5G097800 [Panicum hallii var. hallii]|uniref:Uncharacterized protein n=1 Tax=Panicum hallii var. hallii TaxID=1504633 RepID=A0A2T7DER6_9POAL|nr:hypothetical protein GQ55_5G097800 [Panicum hallii var. hallii]
MIRASLTVKEHPDHQASSPRSRNEEEEEEEHDVVGSSRASNLPVPDPEASVPRTRLPRGGNGTHGTVRRSAAHHSALAGVGKAAGTGWGEPCPAAVGASTSAASAPTRRRAPPGARRRDRGGPAVLPSCLAGR